MRSLHTLSKAPLPLGSLDVTSTGVPPGHPSYALRLLKPLWVGGDENVLYLEGGDGRATV